MVARISLFVLVVILLSSSYLDRHWLCQKTWYKRWMRALWWISVATMLAVTGALALTPHFVPDNIDLLHLYLQIVVLWEIPKGIVALTLWITKRKGIRKKLWRVNATWGAGWCLAVLGVIMGGWGFFIGPKQLVVKRVNITSTRLPEAFDGYRIVQISDAHVGSFTGKRREWLARDVDSVLMLKPDLIVFTGDLQNAQPKEIKPFVPLLTRLKARDGVITIMGNHDYAEYTQFPANVERAHIQQTIQLEKECGWQMLRNEHLTIYRGTDSMVVVGLENYEYPQLASLDQAFKRLKGRPFTLLLEHQPKAWEKMIVPSKRVDLTLSGHTHGGQIQVAGLRPTQLMGNPDKGLYKKENTALYVNAGLGGVVRFRLFQPAEITLITLHTKKKRETSSAHSHLSNSN